MAKLKVRLAAWFSMVLMAAAAFASLAQSLEEENVIAALALNIARYTTWPEKTLAEAKGELRFCAYGDNVVQESFATLNGKTVGKLTVQKIEISRFHGLEQCHVLFIDEIKEPLVLLQVFQNNKTRPLLTIGHGAKFAEIGGIVGLQKEQGKISLHINLSAMRSAELVINAKILKLAHLKGK